MTATLRGYTLRGTYADLPRSKPDPTLPSGWTGPANYTPTTDAELATALTNAAAASGLQIIELAANTTITGVSRSLPVKVDNYPIVIRTSAFASLPERRITTGDAALLATIESSATNPWCITSAFNAHDYYFVGIKITRLSTGTNPTNLVRLGVGGGSTNPTTPDDLPTRIFFDRCWFQGESNAIKAGLRFDVNIGAITRCRIANIHNTGDDAQAIFIINNKPGMPILIHDNYLEATGENIILGGSNPPLSTWPWNVWDVTITKNHFYKPLSWCEHAGVLYAGTNYVVKNIFELKCGRRILVEGNILEHTWGPDQDGAAFVLKSSMDASSALYCKEYGMHDVTIRHNIVRHVAAAFRGAGIQDASHSGARGGRVYIHDNLCYGIYQSKSINWSASAIHQCECVLGMRGWTLDHNTFYTPSTTSYGHYIEGVSLKLKKLRITNNLFSRATNGGIRQGGYAEGTTSLNQAAPSSYVCEYNAFPNVTLGNYPANNFAPNTVAAIGYTNATNDDDGDYTLTALSAYKNAGSDGRDLGCDVAKVLFHTAGVDS